MSKVAMRFGEVINHSECLIAAPRHSIPSFPQIRQLRSDNHAVAAVPDPHPDCRWPHPDCRGTPVASGWSGRRVGVAPTGKAPALSLRTWKADFCIRFLHELTDWPDKTGTATRKSLIWRRYCC